MSKYRVIAYGDDDAPPQIFDTLDQARIYVYDQATEVISQNLKELIAEEAQNFDIYLVGKDGEIIEIENIYP